MNRLAARPAGRLAAAALAAASLLAQACGDDGGAADPAANNAVVTFPKTFLWGTSVAGFQVDPGCPTLPAAACEDRESDWAQWVTDPDLVADGTTYVHGDPLSAGPGFWELYDQDLARAGDELGANAFRTSLEWSRLFPDGAAEAATTVDELAPFADEDAVAHYRAIFASAKAHGQTLLVTLNHYTLPLWLHDGKACHQDLAGCADRGWLDGPRIVRTIALYAGFCARTFGDQVDLWATLNEPFAVVLSGFIVPNAERTNPPGVLLQIEAGLDAMTHMIEAHAAMVDAVRDNDLADADDDGVAAQVGLVHSMIALEPSDPSSEADVAAVAHAEWVVNRVFLEGVANGRLDPDLDGVLDPPRADLVGRLDFIGVNYYTRLPIMALGQPLDARYAFADFLPNLDGGSFVEYPQGLHDVVTSAASYGRPVYITENGRLNPGETSGDGFLEPHLEALHAAMDDGADVRGYFYWSLVDNYEWNHGMSLRFGLYAVDTATKARALRPIGARYAQIVRARGF
ncbi:MAG: glycoside hydrolase family 1 protein [Deltaproteobacteria bacterium]|nr:glycoside hydrolase family 1 protein [Deltaproteobacteria bacterium]